MATGERGGGMVNERSTGDASNDGIMPLGLSQKKSAYEDAPLRPFHIRATIGSIGGVFSDGYGLGIVGLSLSAASAQLALTPTWMGLIGAGSLAGLFAGALLTGPAADRFGRRPIFACNMAFLAVFCSLQFFVTSPDQLLFLRLLIG